MFFSAIEEKAARAARKTALGAGAAISFLVGAAFLTAAAWIYISAVADTLTAAIVIGAVYVGLAFVLMGFAGAKSSTSSPSPDRVRTPPTPAPDDPTADFPPLARAFIVGLQTGANAGRKKT